VAEEHRAWLQLQSELARLSTLNRAGMIGEQFA